MRHTWNQETNPKNYPVLSEYIMPLRDGMKPTTPDESFFCPDKIDVKKLTQRDITCSELTCIECWTLYYRGGRIDSLCQNADYCLDVMTWSLNIASDLEMEVYPREGKFL